MSYEQLKSEFKRVLLSRHIKEKIAEDCATLFADTTLSGVYSHGVNRFPRFIYQLDHGHIRPDAEPEKILSLGAIEQWNAHQSIGNLTAVRMMDRAIELASQHGIGVVALKNANHWMRGGTYGLQAAKKGYIGICWTNSLAVMPPWGGKEPRVGTNPLVIAVPSDPPTYVDMSCSMFSYGKLEVTRLAGKQTPVDAGFDDDGNLTRDPATIEKNRRLLPMGYWKGSGLSIVLDMIATLLSGGLSVAEVSEDLDDEYRVSQIFMAIEVDRLTDGKTRAEKLQRITNYVLSATPNQPDETIRLPGHNLEKTIAKHHTQGIPVDDSVWNKILSL
ncbi:MAG: 3-dehydro-L-gulonate 2-dehydrogenase [Cardiobacteriaceae bacterium]|nr:3-dehydro-L-gulonate 2-dehydrogenase [Cardiobacteriaceae bacterium]